MIVLHRFAIQLLTDVLRFAVLLFRPSSALVAENLFLRRQLALYKERGVKPRRIDAATRMSLALLAWLEDGSTRLNFAQAQRLQAAADADSVKLPLVPVWSSCPAGRSFADWVRP